jgi:hypothetical protein
MKTKSILILIIMLVFFVSNSKPGQTVFNLHNTAAKANSGPEKYMSSITLTSPNGGENLTAGTTHQIIWTSESVANVKIDYSTNNGINWINVTASVPASNGNYTWVIPNTPSTNCKVVISDVSNALLKDESDSVFTISPAVLPSIQLTSPNGGENWPVGSEQNIAWISNDIENIKLDYTTNSGANWINIAPSIPVAGGSFIWTIPNTPSENCAVLVSDVNNALLNDQSDDKFTISPQIIPEIIVTSPNGGEQWQGGTLKNITWSSTAVTNVKIDYSTNNGTNWVNVVASLSASSGTYAWSVPNTPSANCKVLISDVNNALINDQSNNVFSIFNYSAGITINTSFNFGDVTKTSSYKLLGLPGNVNIPLASIMTGNPGKENDWRAFWENGTSPLIEYNESNTFTFAPGKAYFVISKNQIVINQNVNAVQLAADNTYSIPLHNEWNLISNPFDKTISWSSVQNSNSASQPIHQFQNGSYISPANFEPYNGYYFFNSGGLTALKIPYNTPGNLEKNNSPDKKELEITITSDNENKSQVTIGFSEWAETGTDLLDIFSPPSQFCEINISIYNKEIETSYKHLQKEYRKEINEGQEFNILVENNSDKNLKMFFNGLENFIDYEIYLIDIIKDKSYDLKKTENIEIKYNSNLRAFTLLIGTKEYIQQKQTNLIPDEYLLYQNYPNPFNPSTVISYQLPVSGNVSLKVYDILGREIITLVDEYKNAGRYEIEFHPVSGIQHPASGIYFYQLRSGSFVETNKMILLR